MLRTNWTWITDRAAPIFSAEFLRNRRLKAKEQNSGKISETLEKWLLENCNLAYFIPKRLRYL